MPVERRLSVRHPHRCPLTLAGGEGLRFAAQSTDVARAGLGLETDREAVVALAQGGALLTPGDRVGVHLPGVAPGDPEAVLPARVRHVRRVSQGRYHVGVVFEALDPEGEARLAERVALAREHSPL